MRLRHIQGMRRGLWVLFLLVAALGTRANASATLLLEEPYGKLGFFTGTGHAAVYLSGVCAETPVVLRRCQPGETGVVISRYDRVGGYDWVAIPLIPYLYAVEPPEDVPLFADAKMVAFLRDRYRRKYLEAIAPDAPNGRAPGGNWYELVGSSYDRTIYGFEIETTPEQDDALIRKYNSSPNESHFSLVANNCADFARELMNFYYPKALHRSLVADIGMTTPKQMAKRLIKYSARHPELEFSQLIFPQVPGSMPRSTATHGVVESFLKSKKYFVPSAIVSPIFAGCVAAVYVGTGAGHFDPARNALVFNPGSDPERPLGREDRRAYQTEFEHLLAGMQPELSGARVEKDWQRKQSHARAGLDEEGQPILRMQVGQHLVSVGASAANVFNGTAPAQLTQELLEARLQAELRQKKQPYVSEDDVARDWQLLQQAIAGDEPQVATRATAGSLGSIRLGSENADGTRP